MQCGMLAGGADLLPCVGAEWSDRKTVYCVGCEEAERDGCGAWLLRQRAGNKKADQED